MRYSCWFLLSVARSGDVSDFQPFLPHRPIGFEILRRSLEDDLAMTHDIETAADLQRNRQFLLDQQHRSPALGYLLDQGADEFDHHRGQSLGRLIDHDQAWIAHQRATNRQHLLLAARQNPGWSFCALAKPREQVEHLLHRPPRASVAAALTHHQILAHRQSRKDLALLRDIAEPSAGDLVWLKSDHLPARKFDRSPDIDIAHDGFQHGRAAHAIAAEHADDFSRADVEIQSLDDVALSVKRMQGAHTHQRRRFARARRFCRRIRHGRAPLWCAAWPKYASCTAALARISAGVPVATISP